MELLQSFTKPSTSTFEFVQNEHLKKMVWFTWIFDIWILHLQYDLFEIMALNGNICQLKFAEH